MTFLEFCFNIDRVKAGDSYNKEYEYWTIDKNGTFLFMTCNRSKEFYVDANSVKDIKLENYIDYIRKNYWMDKPLFIPYEELVIYENIFIEFEGTITYDFGQKYPLICVRGTCDKQCRVKELRKYCFHKLPCTNKRPDWNWWTGKYPTFHNFIFDVVDWIEVCPHMDALVILFECTPNECENDLDFNYCCPLLIKDNKIKVIGGTKRAKALYEEYNKKYPTEDREIEKAISHPEEDFHFRF